jgi:UDP-glucose:(heptosyl)LPS alpha-1,3-glucosyltransferase
MKVAIVIEHFNARRGGAETYTSYLVDRLAADGHEVTVMAEDWATEPARTTMVRVPVKGMTAAGRVLSFATEASEMASEGGFDVVHSMARIVYVNVFQPHGGVTRASMEKSLESTESQVGRGLRKAARWLNTKSDMLLELDGIIYTETPPPRFVAVSKMVADDMHHWYGVPYGSVDVVYNGVDVDRFGPMRRVQQRPAARGELHLDAAQVAVLLVAHNYRLKGAEVFIKSIAEVVKRGHKNVRGIIVGGGKDAGVYDRLAKGLGVGDAITIHGAADRIEKYYAAADIYLHPTFYDPMSLVVLEALASELPVITTRHNGASEIIHEGREGFIIEDPRDVSAIVDALEKMLDAKRRDEMAAAARALAEEYPLERNYRGILEVYEKAKAEGARPEIKLRKAK